MNAAAPFALNAAFAANAAADGGAGGPYVYTVSLAPPRSLVRVFTYDFGDFELPGPGALLHLQAARPFFEQLINMHLPFNVAVEIVYNITVHDNHELHRIAIPPICCADGLQNAHNWQTFIDHMNVQVNERVDNAEAGESGATFDSIKTVKLTFAPLGDLAAVGAHIQPAPAGGTYVQLPKWILDKHCVMNPKNKDNACFRCCLIASEIGFAEPVSYTHLTLPTNREV